MTNHLFPNDVVCAVSHYIVPCAGLVVEIVVNSNCSIQTFTNLLNVLMKHEMIILIMLII